MTQIGQFIHMAELSELINFSLMACLYRYVLKGVTSIKISPRQLLISTILTRQILDSLILEDALLSHLIRYRQLISMHFWSTTVSHPLSAYYATALLLVVTFIYSIGRT